MCRFIVWKVWEGVDFWDLAPVLSQFFALLHEQEVQSGMSRETLKVNATPHRTEADAAIVLFWSHDKKRPIGTKNEPNDVSAVTHTFDGRGHYYTKNRQKWKTIEILRSKEITGMSKIEFKIRTLCVIV